MQDSAEVKRASDPAELVRGGREPPDVSVGI